MRQSIEPVSVLDAKSALRISLETATQESVEGDICGPVRIQIEGFRPIYNEVLFVEMKPEDGIDEALIGYIVLEQSQAVIDMLGHRLVPIKHMDLKSISLRRPGSRFLRGLEKSICSD